MSFPTWAGIIVTMLGGLGGVAALIKARHDKRIGVRQQDLTEVESLENRLRAEIARLDGAFKEIRDELKAAREENEAFRQGIIEREDYIDKLQHHIYTQAPPPPPPPPQFTR